jgi:hypothetical protein
MRLPTDDDAGDEYNDDDDDATEQGDPSCRASVPYSAMSGVIFNRDTD